MELRHNATYSNSAACASFDLDSDRIVEDRLNTLLAVNSEIRRENSLYRSEVERREAERMRHPVSTEKAFAYFGLMLGSLPPAAIFFRILADKGLPNLLDDLWIVPMLLITNVTAAIVGYFTGMKVATTVRYLHGLSLHRSMLLLPLIGILWGMAAGGAGGLFLFLIGALFGAVIGGTVGAVALPAFAVFHRSLKRGDVIELQQFLPLSFGITLTICAFILGL